MNEFHVQRRVAALHEGYQHFMQVSGYDNNFTNIIYQ